MTPIPEEFIIAKGKAAEEYKERCKVDRDSGHLADCDFSEGAEWAYRLLSSQGLRWVKASERLPDEPGYWGANNKHQEGRSVICKVNGVNGVGYFWRAKNTLHFSYTFNDLNLEEGPYKGCMKTNDSGYIKLEDFDQIEWLLEPKSPASIQ